MGWEEERLALLSDDPVPAVQDTTSDVGDTELQSDGEESNSDGVQQTQDQQVQQTEQVQQVQKDQNQSQTGDDLTDQQKQALELGLPANATQKQIGAAFAAINRRARQEAQEAYERGQNEALARLRQQQQQTQQDPEPDPFRDTDAWKAWNRRQILNEVRSEIMPEVQGLKLDIARNGYDSSLKAWEQAVTKDGGDWKQMVKDANELAAQFPSLANDVYTSKDPGERIVQLAKMALALKGQNPISQAELDRQAEERVTRRIAEQKAAAAAAPQNQIPRGVGNVSNGLGKSPSAPPVSEYQRISKSDPNAWEGLKESIFRE